MKYVNKLIGALVCGYAVVVIAALVVLFIVGPLALCKVAFAVLLA